MDWFREHLNWTAFLTGVVAWFAGITFDQILLLAIGRSFIPYPGNADIQILAFYSYSNTFDYHIMAYIAVFLSAPVFALILL